MSEPIPALRRELDAFASPDPERPGLVLRDPLGYTEAMVLIPPPWLPALRCFDGRQSVLDCQGLLARLSGEIVAAETVRSFVAILDEQGFLETAEFAARRRRLEAEFAAAPARPARHAGAAYPAAAAELRATLAGYFEAAPAAGVVADGGAPLALAAPHVSPGGGPAAYAAAYRQWPADLGGRDLIILGTSHYGRPNRFGLTRKSFETPLGALATAGEAVDFLLARAPNACVLEDYCHAVEHSIEFQCVFARYALAAHGQAAPPPRVVPILCGPIVGDDPEVERFLEALAELAASRPGGWLWLLGIDLAHIGRRYGDALAAQAGTGTMVEVHRRDHERLAAAEAGDAAALRALVRPENDDLRWCGFAPLYAFLRAQPAARGALLRYDQWNIDPESVVSFAALRFAHARA